MRVAPCSINEVEERCGDVWRDAPRVLLDIDAHPRPAVSIANPIHDAVRGVSAQIAQASAPLPPPSTGAMQGPDLAPVVPQQLGRPRPAEARWFIVGDIDAELRPRGLPQRRIDSYELTTLRPWHAVKLRSGSTFQRKTRVGRVDMVLIGGIAGYAERWTKRRRTRWPGPAVWIELEKERWCHGPIEITSITTSIEHAWSVCVDLAVPLSPDALRVIDRWTETLRTRGVAASYPAWIGDRLRTQVIDASSHRRRAI